MKCLSNLWVFHLQLHSDSEEEIQSSDEGKIIGLLYLYESEFFPFFIWSFIWTLLHDKACVVSDVLS